MSIPPAPQTRTRVKWDNILIVVAGASLAAVAVILIMASGSTTKPSATPHKPVATAPATDTATVPTADDGALTLEDSTGLVDEAKDLLAAARFDEALDRLQTVPAEFQEQTGAAALTQQATADRTRYTTLRNQLDAAIEARQFEDAAKLLASMLQMAPKDASLTEAQATIDDGLAAAKAAAAAAKADATTKKPATAAADKTTKQPAANGSSHPSSTPTHTPSNTSPSRPNAPATGGGGTGNVAGTNTAGTGSLSVGNLQLTKEQQQELEQALAGLS